jgi:streptogramin lyase
MSDPMDRNVDLTLDRWMDAVAPERPPSSLLEGTFARTMTASQERRVPWRRVRIRPHRTTAFASIAWVAVAVAVAILVAAVAMLGGGNPPRLTEPTPSPGATASPSPSPDPSPSPSGPLPISVTPEATISVAKPLFMATDGAVPWLINEAGEIVRIDPATNAIGASRRIGPPGDPYQGIAVDSNAAWVTDWVAGKLFRADPGTLEATETTTTGALKGVIVTDTGVWVADVRGGVVQRIDPQTMQVAATVNVGPTGPAGPNWLASGLGSVWVDVPSNATVTRVDPVTATVQATINAPEGFLPCGGITVGADAAWVTGCAEQKRLIVIDAADNTVRATVDLDGFGYYPVMIEGAPWVSLNRERADNGQIVRVNPLTDTVDRVIVPGTSFHGGGNLVVAAGSVWVFDAIHDALLRLPLSAFGL